MGKVIILLPSFLLVTFLHVSGPLYGIIPPEERAALIALYKSANGNNWENHSGWKASPLELDGFSRIGSEGTWYGITVSNHHVTKIKISSKKLGGHIPPELGNLDNLRQLMLYSNRLSGALPYELGELKNLQHLHLWGNQLNEIIFYFFSRAFSNRSPRVPPEVLGFFL